MEPDVPVEFWGLIGEEARNNLSPEVIELAHALYSRGDARKTDEAIEMAKEELGVED